MKIILALLMLCIIILVHEFGHFIIAKANGIEVKEFFVGIGPNIYSKTVNGTKYSLKVFPFGGACVFVDPEAEEEQIEQCSYEKASVYSRIATVLAGPLFNFLFAFLCSLFVIADTGISGTVISEVAKDSPAFRADIQAGDEILKVNNSRVYMYGEIVMETMTNKGEPMNLLVKRGNEKSKVTTTPEYDEEYERNMLGVTFDGRGRKPNPIETIQYSFYNVRYWIKLTVKSIQMLFGGQAKLDDLSGPVGVTQAVGEVYDSASNYGVMAIIYSMLDMTILISANLGVMNLLPFPAIDGGKLVFLIIEAVTKKRVNRKIEGAINFVGMLLLFGLMILVLFNDITKIFR